MDKFGRYYAWFLLVATGLPAVVRLAAPSNFALLTSERLGTERKRRQYRLLGWISFAGSFVLVPVYVFYSHARWLVVAFLIGIITGIEMVMNARRPERESLVDQSRLFGVAYVLCAIFTYFYVLYQH